MTNTIKFFNQCPCWKCLTEDGSDRVRVRPAKHYASDSVIGRVHVNTQMKFYNEFYLSATAVCQRLVRASI